MRPRPAPAPATAPPDAPVFTPVASASPRHDGWTTERQRDFVAQLARIGVVSAAAKAIGMSAKSAYALRKRPGAESFAAAWDAAVAAGRGVALDIAIERALNGTTTPILYRGRHVGVRRHYDNRLVIAAIRTIPPAESTLSLAEAMAALTDIPESAETW